MKKIKLSFLLVALGTLSACQGNNPFNPSNNESWYSNTIQTQIIGMSGDSVQPFDKETNSMLNQLDAVISPFDTTISVTRYQNNQNFSDITSLVRNNFSELHAYFDSHYDYKINGNLINNLKTINDHYGDGEFIEVNDDLYSILQTAVRVTEVADGYYNIGIKEIWDMVGEYIRFTKESGYFDYKRTEQSKYWMYESINDTLRDTFYHNPVVEKMLGFTEKQVLSNEISSFVAAKRMIDLFLDDLAKR